MWLGRVTEGLRSFTKASVLLRKVPLLLVMACVPSHVLVTFDCVLPTQEHNADAFCSVSFILFFLEWQRTVLLWSYSPAGQKTSPLPPAVVHDRKIQLPAAKNVSRSCHRAPHLGAEAITAGEGWGWPERYLGLKTVDWCVH